MKLQNKVLIATGAILIVIMIFSMIVVSIILYSQNRKISNNALRNTSNILYSRLEESGAELRSHSIQMATSNDMGGKLKYIAVK